MNGGLSALWSNHCRGLLMGAITTNNEQNCKPLEGRMASGSFRLCRSCGVGTPAILPKGLHMGEAKRKRKQPCICGSTRPAEQCCWYEGQWKKVPSQVEIVSTGFNGSTNAATFVASIRALTRFLASIYFLQRSWMPSAIHKSASPDFLGK
jgi:hypothetical protein